MSDNWWERDAREDESAEEETSWYEADEVVAGDPSRPVGGRGLGGRTPDLEREEEPTPTFDERAPRRSETFGPGPSANRPDPVQSQLDAEPDPFADEGLGDLSKRRGQQFARGATEVAASVPEALSILGRDITRERHASVVEAIPALAEERKTLMGIIADNEDQSPRSIAATMRLSKVEGEIIRAARMVSEDEEVMKTPIQETGTFKLGDKLRDASTETFGAPDERDRSFWAQVAEGGGNMVGMAAISVLPGGVAAGAGLGSAMNSSQIFKEALEAGSSEEDALFASRWGAAIGASEIVPITRALKLLPPRLRDKIGSGVYKSVKDIAQGAGEEAAQEYLATVANNIVAQKLYDPDRGWTEGATESALVGAVLGGGIGAVGTAFDRGEPEDRERLSSARLTDDDRASPLRNDVIDDGKAIIDELLNPSATNEAAPIVPQPVQPVTAPRAAPEGVDLPAGAVPLSELYGEADPEAAPALPLTPEMRVPEASEPSPLAPEPSAPLAETALPPEQAETATDPAPTAPAQADATPQDSAKQIELVDNEAIQSIETDAKTFQYKAGGDENGVSERLKDVTKWDSNRTGVALVYEYADGRRVIADGHQRLGLAKRLSAEGQPVDLPIRVLREVDGVTESEARSIAAEKNIAEGTGSALDAAKVFRESGKGAKDLNLPRSSAMVRDGESMSKLSPDAFGMVVNEVANQRDGAMVGRLVEDQNRHSDILGLLARIKPANVTQAESIVRQATETEVTETQTSLFGEEEVSANLYLERAKVLDRAMKDLRLNEQTFKVLVQRGDTITATGNNVLDQDANASQMDADAKARMYLMKEANTKGPISDALTTAARAIKDGEKPGKAARDFLIAIRTANEQGAADGAGNGGSGVRAGQAGVDGPAATGSTATQDAPVSSGSRSGTKDDGATDITEAGDQSVMPGFEKAPDKNVAENQMDKPMRGGNAATQEGGLFDDDARNQSGLFDAPTDGPDAAPKADSDKGMGTDDAQSAKGQIGTNSRGNPIFEDENGVRSYQEGGVRVTEGVNIIPGKGSYVDPEKRGNNYLTEAERAEKATSSTAKKPSAMEKALADMLEQQGRPKAPAASKPDTPAARKYPGQGAPIYRGDGGGVSTPYGLSIAGKGKYSAFSRVAAEEFGGSISEGKLDLENPLMIQSDDEWRALTNKSGWEFPNPFGSNKEELTKMTADLRAEVKKAGHDGLVILFDAQTMYDVDDKGRKIKNLRNVFSVPQVVDYREAGSDAATKAPAKASGPKFEGPRKDNTSSMTLEEQDRLAALRAKYRDKVKNQINAGLDPELLSIAAEMGSIYIKAGARKFRDLVRAMMEDLGLTFDQVQPYARAAYNQTRGDMDLDGADVSDMDTDAEVIAEVKAMRAESAAPADPAPKAEPKAEAKPAKQRTGTKPTYIYRPVLNADDLRAWAKEQGFTSTLPADDMHVTIVYAKTPVDQGKAELAPQSSGLFVVGGKRSVTTLGDEGAVVLKFEDMGLDSRWEQLQGAGAKSSFPSYTPHVTITYDGAPADLSKVEPYRGDIELGPEVVEDITDDFDPNDTKEPSTKTAPDPAPNENGFKQRLIDGFYTAFNGGESFATIIQARKKVEEYTGTPYSPHMAKELEEAIEVAVVRKARQMIKEGGGKQEIELFQDLTALYTQQQPTLGQRTSSSIEMQAYSTPAPLAYLASRLGDVAGAKLAVYEPSAGNGMLLIEADPKKAMANELQEERADGIRRALGEGVQITNSDAMTHSLARAYDRLITNPPFGKVRDDVGKTKVFDLKGLDATTTEIDHAIVAKTLAEMRENGRAVLIIGGQKGKTQEERRAQYVKGERRKFFKRLYDAYNVTEHFTADGSLYMKQGAGWPVDVIVIEGRGASSKPYPMKQAPVLYSSWEALGERLNGKDSLDTRELTNGDRDSDNGATDQASDAEPVPGGAVLNDRPDGSASGSGSTRGAGNSGTDRGSVSGAQSGNSRGRAGVRERAPDGTLGDADAQLADSTGPDQAADRADSGRARGTDSDGVSGDGVPRERVERQNEEAETSFQVQYTPRSNATFAVGTLVPKNMQQAMSRALDDLEMRVGDIDGFVAKKLGYTVDDMLGTDAKPGYFSAEQMDALALAIDNVEQGKAFIIGDQTGVGKGRFVAAMLRYASRNDMTPVFVSKDAGLYADMIRDMRDIGMPNAHKHALMTNTDLRGKNALPLSPKDGDTMTSLTPAKMKAALASLTSTGKLPKGIDFLFTTYSQMQQVKGQNTPRMAALEAIAPNAMFVLDESHEAGGGTAGASADGKMPRSQFIRALLNEARGAVFSSATYAKNPSVMSLYAKTDLSLSVDKIDELEDMILTGGVPLQQVMANMLVESGQYARRERSFEGVEMNMKQLVTDKEMASRGAEVMRTLFNLDVLVMQDVREEYIKNAEGEGMAGVADTAVGGSGMTSTNFASTMHNVAAQFLLAIKVKAVVDDAVALHKAGKKPIIALSNTNAAIIKEAADESGVVNGQGLNVPFNKILERYLERLRRITVKDDNDDKSYIYLTDNDIAQYGGGAALKAFKDAQKFIAESDLSGLPGSPIDAILDGLEAEGINAGEITGRNVTLRHNVLESREASPAAKKRVMNAYNDGTLDALVINRSGSTGFSMHATGKPGNDGKERHMIILQPEPNIDLFMQMLGRIHRTGQIKLPGYTIAVSDLAVEKRPAAVLMRKMASFNANTTANKKSAVSLDNVVDFLNEYGDTVVAEYLRENPMLAVALDLGIPTNKTKDGIAAKFTGRLVSQPPNDVTRIYEDVEGAYVDFIDALDRMGMNTLEAKVLELDAKTLDETELVPAKEEQSPFGQAAYVQTVDVKRLGKPYSPEQLEAEVETATGGEDAQTFMFNQVAELRGLLGGMEKKMDERLQAATAKIAEANTDKQKDAAADTVKRIQDQIAGLRGRFMQISDKMEEMTAGRVGVISFGQGDSAQSFAAMSLGVDTKRIKDNPTAASNIVVRIAIADAGREVRVPISRFMGEGGYGWNAMPDRQRGSILGAFKNGQSESRENRQMLTGNIPAGFAQFKKGQIVIYTDDTGKVRQGVMLPKNFEAGSALQNRPVKMTPAQVAQFLEGGDYGSRVVQTDDGVISMSFNEGRFSILVKTQGHKKYTLNKAVQKILGEWEQRRGAKFFRKTTYEATKLAEVLTIYADNLGTEYSTTTSRDAAREITGEVLPEIRNLNDDDGTQAKFAVRRDRAELEADLDPADTTVMAEGQLYGVTTPEAKAEAKELSRAMNRELIKLGLPGMKAEVVEQAFGLMGDNKFAPLDGAYFKSLVVVALESGRNAVDTLRHEAIHALRDPALWGREFGLFRSAEWKALEAAAKADKARMAEAREVYPNETDQFLWEEVIADMFADYVAGRLKPKGFVAAGLKRVQQAYEAIRSALRGEGFQTAESIFAKAARGEVGRRQTEGKGRIEPKLTSAKPKYAASRAQERTDSQVSKFVDEDVTHAVMHDTPIEQRKDSFIKAMMTQPLDAAFRVPFMVVGGIDRYGRWKYGKAAEAKLKSAIKDSNMGFMSPIVEAVRAGMIDRHGLSQEYIERDRRRGIDEALLAAEGTEHVKALMDRDMSAQEAKVLQAVLTGEAVAAEDMAKLAEPVRVAIDGLGSEAVALGLISRESYERNRGTYLHRVYDKHEFEAGHVERWASKFTSGRRRKIVGNQFKGRGLFEEVDSEKILRDNEEFLSARRGKAVNGEKFVMLELDTTTGTEALATLDSPKGRLKRRVYWPAGKPIPAKLDNYVNRGTFEVRGFKGSKVVLWRDFTKAERTKMGEILDARYTIAKTYAVMSKDLATGRFFKDIAENEEWSRKEPPEGERVDLDPVRDSLRKRMWATPDLKWVKVPETKISKSDAYQYGALAGRYVRAEIWRDMEETRAMSSPNFYQKILTQWKLNKTARSPVVHMNNVMSNFMLMDMADVRLPDLMKGISSMASGDLAYQEAATAGAFGADMVTQELRDNVLKPLMKELATEMRGDKGSLEGGLGSLGKIMDRIAAGAGYLDQKMIAAYQMEDQVFRMATYIRRREQGMSVNEAAVEARDQFLNYDIRAPWVNMARRTVLPFASYTYRAVPKIAQTIAERPWKIAKYVAIYQSLNMLAYAVAPSEYDEEEERKSLREEESGMMGFLGIPVSERLLRMPWLSNGDPVFLDVRRWIPAGDVFDTRGGDLPSPLHMGGPLITGMELYFNRSAFTGDDIMNPMTDTLAERTGKQAKFAYQSFVPSAPWVPGSWYFEKIKRAVWDDAMQWGSNEPYDPLEAVLSSAGIKLKPKDVQLGYRSWQMDYDRQERELAFQRSSLKRQAQRKLIDRKTYEKAFNKLMEKRARLRAAKAERFGK